MRAAPSTLALLGLAACLALPAPASANPWTRDRGRFYINLNVSHLSATGLYGADFVAHALKDVDGDGAAEPYTQQSLGLYAEVGIVDRWMMATLDATLLRRSSLAQQGSTIGLGDLRLGLWSGVMTLPFNLSVGVLLGIPTGDPVPQADALPAGASDAARRSARQTANSLPTGDGEFDLELALSAGYSLGGRGSWWPIQHYLVAQVGYWVRTTPREVAFGEASDLPDAFNWRVETGARLDLPVVDRLLVIFRLFGSESLARDDQISMNAGGLGAATHASWTLELYGRVWRGLGASFSLGGAWRVAGLPSGSNYRWSLSYEY